MTPSSPQQVEAAYEYLQFCRADVSPTVTLDSIRISKLTLAKAVPFKEKVSNLFHRFKLERPVSQKIATDKTIFRILEQVSKKAS